jgi:hypothetical protein
MVNLSGAYLIMAFPGNVKKTKLLSPLKSLGSSVDSGIGTKALSIEERPGVSGSGTKALSIEPKLPENPKTKIGKWIALLNIIIPLTYTSVFF